MKKCDIIYWSGFMAGAIGGGTVLRAAGIDGLFFTLGAVAAGVACGFVLEKLYARAKEQDQSGDIPPQ